MQKAVFGKAPLNPAATTLKPGNRADKKSDFLLVPYTAEYAFFSEKANIERNVGENKVRVHLRVPLEPIDGESHKMVVFMIAIDGRYAKPIATSELIYRLRATISRRPALNVRGSSSGQGLPDLTNAKAKQDPAGSYLCAL
jgi:hypothetical protein